jgi:hypothetical protein
VVGPLSFAQLILSDHELTNTLIRAALQFCLMFVSCLIDRCVGIERGRDHPLRLAIKGVGTKIHRRARTNTPSQIL